MNSVNKSTGFTPFQLRFGRSPCVLPPLFPSDYTTPMDKLAHDLLKRMALTVKGYAREKSHTSCPFLPLRDFFTPPPPLPLLLNKEFR